MHSSYIHMLYNAPYFSCHLNSHIYIIGRLLMAFELATQINIQTSGDHSIAHNLCASKLLASFNTSCFIIWKIIDASDKKKVMYKIYITGSYNLILIIFCNLVLQPLSRSIHCQQCFGHLTKNVSCIYAYM